MIDGVMGVPHSPPESRRGAHDSIGGVLFAWPHIVLICCLYMIFGCILGWPHWAPWGPTQSHMGFCAHSQTHVFLTSQRMPYGSIEALFPHSAACLRLYGLGQWRIHIYIQAYIHTYIHTGRYTHIHTHIHTYT